MFSKSSSGSLPHPSSIHPSGITSIRTTNLNRNFNFDEDEDNSSTTFGRSIYEEELYRAQKVVSRDEARLAELKMRAEQAKEEAEATQQIQQDINDIGQIMEDLSRLVNEQHDMVDSIEDHVERTVLEVKAAERDLRKAVATQDAVAIPLAAAAAGGVVAGGPVGLAAGSAVAGLVAAIGGAFTGLYGGRKLRKYAVKQVHNGGAGGTSSNSTSGTS